MRALDVIVMGGSVCLPVAAVPFVASNDRYHTPLGICDHNDLASLVHVILDRWIGDADLTGVTGEGPPRHKLSPFGPDDDVVHRLVTLRAPRQVIVEIACHWLRIGRKADVVQRGKQPVSPNHRN